MEMMQPIFMHPQIERAWLKHAHSFDPCGTAGNVSGDVGDVGSITSRCSGNDPVLLPSLFGRETRHERAAEIEPILTGTWIFIKGNVSIATLHFNLSRIHLFPAPPLTSVVGISTRKK